MNPVKFYHALIEHESYRDTITLEHCWQNGLQCYVIPWNAGKIAHTLGISRDNVLRTRRILMKQYYASWSGGRDGEKFYFPIKMMCADSIERERIAEECRIKFNILQYKYKEAERVFNEALEKANAEYYE